MIQTLSSFATLDKIRQLANRGAGFYLRFGGDFAIMDGHQAGWQRHSESLAKELQQAFQIEDPHYIRSVPICYPDEPGMDKLGLRTVTPSQGPYVRLMEHIESLTTQRTFYNANALTYLAVVNPAVLRGFLDRWIVPRRKVFIGSLARPQMERLFGEIAVHVEVPNYSAYNQFDWWWRKAQTAIRDCDNRVILLAAGMSSRVVAKRMWELGTRDRLVIDLGSWIDAFCGLKTRSWIRTADQNGMLDEMKRRLDLA